MSEIKLAIHPNKHSASERWIEYCEKNKINYKLVDCTNTDIIEQLKDCDGLMWHWGQSDYKSQLYARHLTHSLEKMGKKVYPNSNSCWHFDDKVGQKYLFEATGIPFVKSYVFYTKKEALNWIKTVSFPIVFKLRGGAGSVNVSLIRNKTQAIRKVKLAFGIGYPAFSRRVVLEDRFNKFMLNKNAKNFIKLIKSFLRLIIPKEEKLLLPREKGYVYFQEFIPNNEFDTRVVVIGEKMFATRRFVRKNDFRASGSGFDDKTPELINKDILKKAMEVSELLGTQTLAFDFLIDNEEVKIIEISYAFPVLPSDGFPGYWDRELNWHEGFFKSQYWMIENFINEIKKSKSIN